MIRGVALEHLRQHRLGAGELDQLRVLVERNADAARLLGQRLEHGLSDPPHGVRDEFDPLIRIELLHGFQEAFVSDGDELAQVEPMSLVLLHVGDDETEIGRHQPLGGFFVTLLRPTRQAAFFFRVVYEG